MRFILLLFLFFSFSNAKIDIYKQENNDSNSTLLIIGGIHGNEPGSYFAPTIFVKHYKIHSKNVWTVPNLNQESIYAYKRGINGDMNRKFSTLKEDDHDKEIVEEVKSLIQDENVSLILNLHDGHGFYREKYVDVSFNPKAWGQTCVIDQCKLKPEIEFGNLSEIATKVKERVNKNLLHKKHTFNVKNTQTKADNKAMQLSLTYFAALHDKPAFGIETSKYLPSLSKKVFYQLQAIEGFMEVMDINYTKDFNLTEKNIEKMLNDYGTLTINNNIFLNLNNIKNSLSYIPLKSKDNMFNFSHPLGKVKQRFGRYYVHIGNKSVVSLKPQFFELDLNTSKSISVNIDGNETTLELPAEFTVEKSFKISKQKGVRVNVIGWHKKGVTDESGINIELKDIMKKFSIDRNETVFRVEFYAGEKFSGMATVHFK